MKNTQKITLRLSEVRQRLNAIAGLEGDAFTDEIRTESEKLQREYGDLETRQSSTIIADGETATRAATDGEGAEIRQLVQRASLGAFLHGVARERAVDSAEAELRSALNLEGDQIPIDVLMPPRVEERTDAATNVAASVAETQQSIAGRIFSQTGGRLHGSRTAYRGRWRVHLCHAFGGRYRRLSERWRSEGLGGRNLHHQDGRAVEGNGAVPFRHGVHG